MSSMKELLLTEWQKEKDILDGLDVKSKEDGGAYNKQVERVSNLEKLLVDLEKKELDVEAEASKLDIEVDMKCRQIEADKKSLIPKISVEVLKIGAPIVAAFAMGLISMKWEKLDTITSQAGRQAIKEALRFKL